MNVEIWVGDDVEEVTIPDDLLLAPPSPSNDNRQDLYMNKIQRAVMNLIRRARTP